MLLTGMLACQHYYKIRHGSDYDLRDIAVGEEITINYRQFESLPSQQKLELKWNYRSTDRMIPNLTFPNGGTILLDASSTALVRVDPPTSLRSDSHAITTVVSRC
jgi:hypothetical protein